MCLQEGQAGTCFGGNQLSPSLIGLLPLGPGQGSDLHVSTPIQASTELSLSFTLPRPRSLGFGSQDCDLGSIRTPLLTDACILPIFQIFIANSDLED
jgi:hypothetical protein